MTYGLPVSESIHRVRALPRQTLECFGSKESALPRYSKARWFSPRREYKMPIVASRSALSGENLVARGRRSSEEWCAQPRMMGLC